MSTYTKNGQRKYILDNNKAALKQLSNFGDILQNMNLLNKGIESYDGTITEDNLESISKALNLSERLKLTEDQIKMVTKKYEQV